ncbi:MAG: LON peptidase substrate-binding domain-containing protein [Thioalkalispiraceae bacterium]|jgi:Lon protease-like protein
MSVTIPLFPLNTVLFPHGVLPLRVFEPRYLDMISNCLKHDTGIGVILIKQGAETGNAAETFDTGTLSRISYWHKRADGILGITLKGEQRFRVLSHSVEKNQLIMAEVELLPPAENSAIPSGYEHMAVLLQQIIGQLGPPYTTMQSDYESADWVSARLVELLPLRLADKQQLLNMDDIQQRFEKLQAALSRIDT